jgi:hypothetical protein
LAASASLLIVGCASSTAVDHGADAAVGAARTGSLGPASWSLPSDGWTSAQPAMLAEQRGTLQISSSAAGACAWIGLADSPVPVEWPEGWTAVFTTLRAELFDAAGQPAAVAGEQVNVGGGFGPAKVAQCGAQVGSLVFLVQGADPLG